MKSSLHFVDTANAIQPENVVATPGLVLWQMTPGATSGAAARYAPPLNGRLDQPAKLFVPWWTDPVTRDSTGALFSRKDYVLTVANKEGGAHVDPDLPADWGALSRDNSLGFSYVAETTEEGSSVTMISSPAGGTLSPFNDPVPPTIRQIAYELQETIQGQIGDLL